MQKKMKRIKSEFSATIGDPNFGGIIKSERDIMSMNFGNGSNALAASTTTMATSTSMQSASTGLVPQIINVNQYTNQTYVINNISTSGMVGGSGLTGMGGQNYANSYYGWPTSNYSPEAGSYSQFNQIQPVQTHQQLQIQQPVSQIQSSSNSVKDNLEDSVGSPYKEMIKTIHECYQRHLSPAVLLKKDFVTSGSTSKSGFNSITNTFGNNNRVAIGYHNNSNGIYDEAYNGGDNFYSNLHEIAEHFRFYATNLASFLHEISGNFTFFFHS